MDDFEYSVEISDRDWQCFFAECEECNLLPPSLAGVDSSGMSDLDDSESMLAKRVQKVNLTTHFSDADHSLAGPTDCEGPPVEQFVSKHGVSGMENILSGSEEDLHLQSVNIFFERVKNLTEAERLAEPRKVRAGKNRGAVEEEQQCSDGQQASSSATLPKNTPKLNSLSARGETAVGKRLSRAVDTISNINTMKKVEPSFNISPEPAASNSVAKTNKSAYPETDLFICEEACTEARVTQENQVHDSPVRVVFSKTKPHTDKVIDVDTCTHDLSRSHLTPEILTSIKWKEDENPNVPLSDATSTNKTPSQESSPSASIKRKRRKKRRLSAEPVESGHGGRTQDSEEEEYAWRGEAGLCLCKDDDLLCSHRLQNNLMSSLYSVTRNPPGRISGKEMKINDLSNYVSPCDSQYQYPPGGWCTAKTSAEIHPYNSSQSVTPLNQTDDGLIKTPTISGNVVTHLQPRMKLQVEELPGLNKYCCLPHSFSASLTDKSDRARGNRNGEPNEDPAGNLQQPNNLNHSNIGCENEQNLNFCTAEVKSIPLSILPNADSNDPAVEVSQSDKLSAAKLVQAADNHTLCQRDSEHQQQLELDTDRYVSAPGKTPLPLSATGMISADCHNTKHEQFTARAFLSSDKMSSEVASAKLAENLGNSSRDKSSLFNSPSNLYMNNTVQQILIFSKSDVLSEKNRADERAELEPTQIMAVNSSSSSEFALLSSCCTLDADSVLSVSNDNITDICESCSPFSPNGLCGQKEKQALISAKHMEGEATFAPKIHNVLNDSNQSGSDLLGGEEVVKASKAEPKEARGSQHSVFSISSFWSEMEKLTINDILSLQMIDKDAPPSSLPPLWENEETSMFATTDSGFFTQLDESRSEQTNECMLRVSDSVQSSLPSATAPNSSSSRSVIWEREPVPVSLGADVYPDNMMLISVGDISQPVLSQSAQKCLRKISKNISVHNLHALESEPCSSTWKQQTLPTADVGELEKVETFTDEHVLKEDKDTDSSPSSLTGSYTSSLMDIFQYLFGGTQPIARQSSTDNTSNFSTDGKSLPETYDHFFSEFDTESFFCPLVAAEDHTKDELVPIFSCSRSANRNLQFPEAYEYFFPSSSSDDSSVESDEEDNCGSVKVVTRFSRNSSASKMSVDVYDNFFTDSDLRQNFFWKETFSFRNIKFTGSTQPISNPLSLVPVRQSDRSLRRWVCPSNVLGNQDLISPDPLLCHLEDRISRQLAQQPFRNEDLQTAVSNPILLANVSALSAIRYLRKYVKIEATASEKKLHSDITSDS
ncbi:hypothetical protein EXN66_Car012455 [Channa argus]|uniref:Uncharacterized protein n=1 Tax=Channa argus TaxID=215402 RepID=A0A6G1Q2P9_CHAAH|nr:hypothetical protein EXN66_Car012455 [Channa argus]